MNIKAILTLALSAIFAYLENMVVPLIVLSIVMLIDYSTGIAKAAFTGGVNSKKGWRGIIKKLCYGVVVAVAFVVDWLLYISTQFTNFNYTANVFGLMIVIWLILNELVSILENVAILGVPIPPILKGTMKNLQNKIDKGDSENA